jgi:hypothetical protein
LECGGCWEVGIHIALGGLGLWLESWVGESLFAAAGGTGCKQSIDGGRAVRVSFAWAAFNGGLNSVDAATLLLGGFEDVSVVTASPRH